MRSSHSSALTSALILAGLGLSACGGTVSYPVSGTISGLTNSSFTPSSLVLANGSDTLTVAPSSSGGSSFTFSKAIDYGTAFNIVVQTQPSHMTCTVLNGLGSAGHTSVINATVTCAVNAYTIGGTITGLTGSNLELINGSTATPLFPAAGASTFVFASTVAYGQTYGVTVFIQPSTPGSQNCTISNGSGVMQDAAVNNIGVACQ